MEIVRRLVAPCPASTLFDHVDDLERYPEWMDLVHAVTPVPGSDSGPDLPTWDVELRAAVGPFARSKRLRMRRAEHVADQCVVFERAEADGRNHSPWVLRVDLVPVDDGAATQLTMRLEYGGSLWQGAVLERVLDDKVESGSRALLDLVSN